MLTVEVGRKTLMALPVLPAGGVTEYRIRSYFSSAISSLH